MNNMIAIPAPEALELLKKCPDWKYENQRGGVIKRDFAFKDFNEAFGFMKQVALVADELDHHPEWCNTYNRVSIALTTHDSRGLSHKDFNLAKAIDEIASSILEY